ncbi:peptidyl-prolyl cis-trans isomerase FKBP62-like isoform X2 [Telopea speciosissima]|uniref:peptidyl-prolyl cis-trans isomerase FKBP62-like isoform X2 n=1 Tax=Telopea speciosissima TaxID=54955 RepID=UPI001CC7D4BB|nr:peptidyl-prolyl cis-trans isomerase FKBP62-like isoform X2 [Telopea speciosissima]
MAVDKDTQLSNIEDEDELDEEPGEVIESAPPLKVGEEREINSSGLKKKLIVLGHGWETPDFGDEVTVHYLGTLLDGTKFDSSRETEGPFTFKLGHGQIAYGLDHGIITMTKGELALFTLPSDLGCGATGVPPNSVVQFEVELISWITVVDICKDGGIIKKILKKGERDEQPGDLDEVMVKYEVGLADGTIVAKTPDEGMEFYVNDGHFCPALLKALKTMTRGEKANLMVQPLYAFGEQGKDAEDGFPAIPSNAVLSIDLELLSFKPVADVTGDAKVLKKILKEGEGTITANEGAAVTEQVIPGLDRAAATMKKGELCIVTINPEYGFGSVEVKRDLAVVPPSSTVFYEVEMLDFIKEKAPWEMNNTEKIEAAGKKKEEGNILFKSGKYQRAAKRYEKAADYISEDFTFGDDEQKLVKALRVSCWLNHAACCLKLNDFQGAIKLCSKVLDVEFHNVKALYRRAQAYMETEDLYLAELDIKKALEIDPENRDVKKVQKTLKPLQAESNKRDAKLYTNIFAHMWKDDTVVAKRLKVERVEDEERNEEVMAKDMEDGAVGFSSAPANEIAMDSCTSP